MPVPSVSRAHSPPLRAHALHAHRAHSIVRALFTLARVRAGSALSPRAARSTLANHPSIETHIIHAR